MGRERADEPLFASYNIHKCVGTDRQFDPVRVASVIAEIGAQVIALQEVDRRFGDRAGLLDLVSIERVTGLVAVPVARRKDSHGWRGNLLLVRDGSVDAVEHVDLPGQEPRGALVVDLELATGPVRVVATHLGLLRSARRSQIAVLNRVARARHDGRPIVIMGDLNEWRRGRRSALQGLAPSFGPLDPGAASFPTRRPLLALDRIVAHPQRLVVGVTAHDTPLARAASDHLPIKSCIALCEDLIGQKLSAVANGQRATEPGAHASVQQ